VSTPEEIIRQHIAQNICQDCGLPPAEIAQALDLSAEQVQRIIADITSKQRATAYLRLPPLNIDGQPLR
jgi:hypothetical protein